MKLTRTISELIAKIEKLERLFIFYFTGHESRPPLKELASLKNEINRLSLKISDSQNTAEKYLVAQIVNRFTIYRVKWEKGVRDIEEGRAKPGLHFFGGLGTEFTELRKEAENIDKKDYKAIHLASIIDKTARDYVEMNKKHTGKKYDPEDVSRMLEKKVDAIRKKFGDKFSFKVYYEDGKVKVKPEKEE